MLKFCPECGSKLIGSKFCGNCGANLTKYGVSDTVAEEVNTGSALDDAIGGLFGFAKDKQMESKLRTLIIRELYDDAKEICNSLIDNDPMDKVGYIGLIRIASKNYKEYEGTEIAKQIRIAEEIFGAGELSSDSEYTKYITARKRYFEEKERKAVEEAERRRKEEAERRRLEAERAEWERQRRVAEQIAAERAEAERRRIEAEKAEAERKRLEAERVERERQRRVAEQIAAERAEAERKRKAAEEARLRAIEEARREAEARMRAEFEIENGVLEKYHGRRKDLVIPNNVREISHWAFDSNCINGFESLEIPDSMAEIGSSAFSDWGSLKRVKISDSVTKIGMFAFSNCRKLEFVEIPASVKLICSGAFKSCYSLNSILIPKDCVVGNDAFPSGCKIVRR